MPYCERNENQPASLTHDENGKCIFYGPLDSRMIPTMSFPENVSGLCSQIIRERPVIFVAGSVSFDKAWRWRRATTQFVSGVLQGFAVEAYVPLDACAEKGLSTREVVAGRGFAGMLVSDGLVYPDRLVGLYTLAELVLSKMTGLPIYKNEVPCCVSKIDLDVVMPERIALLQNDSLPVYQHLISNQNWLREIGCSFEPAKVLDPTILEEFRNFRYWDYIEQFIGATSLLSLGYTDLLRFRLKPYIESARYGFFDEPPIDELDVRPIVMNINGSVFKVEAVEWESDCRGYEGTWIYPPGDAVARVPVFARFNPSTQTHEIDMNRTFSMEIYHDWYVDCD